VISDHPQGRCTSVPVVRGMPETTWTSGEMWFNQQPEDVQLSIMASGERGAQSKAGRAKLDAYRAGLFKFSDLVTRTDNKTWGKGLTPTPLSKLVA